MLNERAALARKREEMCKRLKKQWEDFENKSQELRVAHDHFPTIVAHTREVLSVPAGDVWAEDTFEIHRYYQPERRTPWEGSYYYWHTTWALVVDGLTFKGIVKQKCSGGPLECTLLYDSTEIDSLSQLADALEWEQEYGSSKKRGTSG